MTQAPGECALKKKKKKNYLSPSGGAVICVMRRFLPMVEPQSLGTKIFPSCFIDEV